MISEKTPTQSRYLELDALRGIAALLVVLFHFTMQREEANLGFNVGITGVYLFFIISGFVIFMSIDSTSSTKEFIINRFTRLYPTYWFCVSFTYIAYVIVNRWSAMPNAIPVTDYLANLTMFQFYLKVPDIDGPYWTMIIEMLFYIFIAIVFTLKQLKFIIPIGLLTIYIIVISDFLAGSIIWPGYFALRTAVPLLNYFPLFFSGIIFYKIMTRAENHFLYYIFLLFLFTLHISSKDTGPFINRSEYITMAVIYFGLFILFVNKKLSFIVSKPSLFLGKISFALYLVHQYVSTQVILPFLLDTCHFNFWFAASICLTVVICLATLITYYIEIPLGKGMNNWLRGIFKLQKRTSDKMEIKKLRIFKITLSILLIVICMVGILHRLGLPKMNDNLIHLKTLNNNYLYVNIEHSNIIMENKNSTALPETFSLLHLENNRCAIYSSGNKYLSAELSQQGEITASRDKVSDWETFIMINFDSNLVAFKASNGKYWSVKEGSSQIFATGEVIGAREKFEMIRH